MTMDCVKTISNNEIEDWVTEVESIMSDISCNINGDRSMKRLSRKRRSSTRAMRVIDTVSRYAIWMIEHFAKKGVTVKTRVPISLDHIIVKLKKVCWKTDHNVNGQGRLEVPTDKKTMLPGPLATYITRYSQGIDVYNKKGWMSGKKVPDSMKQLLHKLIELRRKRQNSRTQG